MSFASSRAFKGFRALLAPSKSAATATTAAALKPKATKTAEKRKSKPADSIKRTGILQATPISSALRDFLGVPESSRTDAVKKIWVYIKDQKLQVFHLTLYYS